MPDLWNDTNAARWTTELARYDHVVAQQGVAKLQSLDVWYRIELPVVMQSRTPASISHTELVQLTEWKMARGIWRAPNLALVRGNGVDAVRSVSTAALGLVPHVTKPIALIATLAGVGPATASAVVAAFAPSVYPFFDELVAAQIPALGKVAWTLGYYARYAAALRERAGTLGPEWTPVMVERALWSHVGGKTGAAYHAGDSVP